MKGYKVKVLALKLAPSEKGHAEGNYTTNPIQKKPKYYMVISFRMIDDAMYPLAVHDADKLQKSDYNSIYRCFSDLGAEYPQPVSAGWLMRQ